MRSSDTARESAPQAASAAADNRVLMEGSEHVPQQVGTGLGEVIFEEAVRADTGCDGHRRGSFVLVPFEMDLAVLSKHHAVTVSSYGATLTEIRYTTLKDATTRLLQPPIFVSVLLESVWEKGCLLYTSDAADE